ncbi:hypothetical protein [Glutamicibacter sp. X7]
MHGTERVTASKATTNCSRTGVEFFRLWACTDMGQAHAQCQAVGGERVATDQDERGMMPVDFVRTYGWLLPTAIFGTLAFVTSINPWVLGAFAAVSIAMIHFCAMKIQRRRQAQQ